MGTSVQKNEKRCSWTSDDPLMVAYHDWEWGVPLHDGRKLLGFLVLEGARAGLSWSSVLRSKLLIFSVVSQRIRSLLILIYLFGD
jgi:hypothetical protein